MTPITPTEICYIKLGSGGRWAECGLERGEMHFGYSAIWARSALTSIVRWRTSNSRVRCTIRTLCCSGPFTATKRMAGRVTASQIAAASAASFLFRFT